MLTRPPYAKMMERNNGKTRAVASRWRILILFLFTALGDMHAQTSADSTALDRRKLNTLMITAGVGYTAGLITLNHMWYKDTERQSFRFFNDNAEWKQVDKAGHFFSSFFLSEVTSRALISSRVRARKADAIGALSGFLLTIPIEIFDGYSSGYGASAGDAVADAAGPLFYLGQRLLWDDVRIRPRFSFHRTGYAPLRPELLGDSWLSEVVKDYNGQTYWLSVDADKFAPFPKWLNLAAGYGAHEMVYARDHENALNGFSPYRQYYIALDFDLSSIQTRSKWVKALLYVVNCIHLPAPAVEFSPRGTKFHPFYF